MLGLRGDPGAPRLKVRYAAPVKAPLHKGDRIGQLTVYYPDGLRQDFPLVAANDVAAANFFQRAWNGLRSLWSSVA